MVYVLLRHSLNVALACSSRYLVAGPRLVSWVLTLCACASLRLLLLLAHSCRLLLVAFGWIAWRRSGHNCIRIMATACHLLQMLLQLLLLQQLLQGSLSLTVQMPSCSSLYWIADLWHSLVLSLLIALLGRARLLLLRVHAASYVMSKGCGCKLLMVQRCQVLGQDHLLL